MIKIGELEKLKSNIDKVLLLSKKKKIISDEIIGDDEEKVVVGDVEFFNKYTQLQQNPLYRGLENELYAFIFGLPERDLYNLYIAFSIGRLGTSRKNLNDEYLLQLEKAKDLCKDKKYIEDKFMNTRYYYLEKYLRKGFEYLRRVWLYIV